MRDIKRVILHCSATPDYPDSSDKYDLYGVDDFRVWHKKRGWSDVGYHYVVRRSGKLEAGRPLDLVGSHTKGHNTDSIGVCYVGTKDPTTEQIASILALADQLWLVNGLGSEDWFGHYEFTDKKTCPGIPMGMFRLLLDQYIS